MQTQLTKVMQRCAVINCQISLEVCGEGGGYWQGSFNITVVSTWVYTCYVEDAPSLSVLVHQPRNHVSTSNMLRPARWWRIVRRKCELLVLLTYLRAAASHRTFTVPPFPVEHSFMLDLKNVKKDFRYYAEKSKFVLNLTSYCKLHIS